MPLVAVGQHQCTVCMYLCVGIWTADRQAGHENPRLLGQYGRGPRPKGTHGWHIVQQKWETVTSAETGNIHGFILFLCLLQRNHFSIRLSVCLSICLTIHLFICLYVHHCLRTCASWFYA